MTCQKSDLVSTINSYAAARASGDGSLINMSAGVLGKVLEDLEFAPEEVSETEVVEDAS